MAENKTKPGKLLVSEFLQSIESDTKRKDAETLVKLMQDITNEKPVMWATMIGFGEYHYKYASGHEGDAFIVGFAPRKPNLVIYLMPEFAGRDELLSKLGKHKTSKACVYINKLADVDMNVLRKLIETSYFTFKAGL